MKAECVVGSGVGSAVSSRFCCAVVRAKTGQGMGHIGAAWMGKGSAEMLPFACGRCPLFFCLVLSRSARLSLFWGMGKMSPKPTRTHFIHSVYPGFGRQRHDPASGHCWLGLLQLKRPVLVSGSVLVVLWILRVL